MREPTEEQVDALLCSGGPSPHKETNDRVRGRIRACGGLEPAIAACSAEGDLDGLKALLDLRCAWREALDPLLQISRLRASASDMDKRAERLMTQAADLFGQSAYRAAQGEPGLAEDFHTRALALETVAADLTDKAFETRLEAAAVEWRLTQAAALASIAA